MSTDRVRIHNYPVHRCFSNVNGTTKGEIGIEIETIGHHLPTGFQKTKLWSIHPDASIKARAGEMTAEYVLTQPVGRQKVQQALEELLEEFNVAKSKIAEGRLSNSVHVHINAQQLTLQQVFTWLAVYYLFEEFLVRWAGNDRVGNLFCLRAKDAEGLIYMLARAAKHDDLSSFGSDSYRYSAVNVVALQKYGSLEFRALRGTCDQETILTWVSALLAIKDASLEYKDPTEVLADFSKRGCMGFTNHVLPPELRSFVYSQPDFQKVQYEGARLAQDFAFATIWQSKPVKADDIPKGRSKKSVFDLGDQVAAYTQILEDTTEPGLTSPTWTGAAWSATGGVAFTQNTIQPASVDPQPTVPPARNWTVVMVNHGGRLIPCMRQPGETARRIQIRLSLIHGMIQNNRTFTWHVTSQGRNGLAIRNSAGVVSRFLEPIDFIFATPTGDEEDL